MKSITTEDGAITFYNKELDEYYHSVYGAFQESDIVFINAGFRAVESEKIVIFEMGFGTGLNAFKTYLANKEAGKEIIYITVEAYPIPLEKIAALNYASVLGDADDARIFEEMHATSWNKTHQIAPNFSIHKLHQKIQDIEYKHLPQFDVVYYDAFAPSAQAELWEKGVIEKLYDQLKSNGILVTYCAKGTFKRTLKALEFRVEGLPGPKGKREMTRAIKK